YRWKNKDFSISEDEREIIELCKKHRFTYGYRKITALLNRKNNRKFQLQVSHYIQINRDSSLMVHLIILRILVTSETGI
ncbi:IS3 family transposase, partial [Macrococcoides caseolyticum]|uniref:IS3 family transposase n=1 Tax=Macrococcoides caseolyticum TaxID=69966 RepID=UPI000CADC153